MVHVDSYVQKERKGHNMVISAMTDIGIKRSVNQDRAVYKIKDHEIVGVLCDGMGGHLAGDVASTLVSNYIIDHFFDHSPFINDESIHAWISSLLLTANDLLNKESDMHSEYAGMGTTIVICYMDGKNTYISHVGDSRAYLYSDTLKQITTDDTFVNELLKRGIINQEEASHHPKRNVLVQAIGIKEALRISFYKIEEDYRAILLCSDGLYNSLSSQQIEDILKEDESVNHKTERLIQSANEFGGLKELIGQGGMADVYLAYDDILKREVAVKILRSSLTGDPIYITRFHREARAAAALCHRNIVEIYDVGEEDDLYYIVMEYVRGQTLKELINKRGALHYVEAVDIMKQVVSATALAHSS